VSLRPFPVLLSTGHGKAALAEQLPRKSRDGASPSYGGNLNDMTSSLLTQVGKNRPGHIHHAPKVGVDLPLEFIGGHFLERTQLTV
jgi:hypothetical protein